MRTAEFFNFQRKLPQALPRGEVYFPGETVLKYGNFNAVIAPYRTAPNVTFEWGEVVALNSDGKVRKIVATDDATNFLGLVHRNATVTYHVQDRQDMGLPLSQTLSIWLGKRQGQIAVPVQNKSNTLVAGNTVAEVAPAGTVYVRVKEHGTEAPTWSNSSIEYKVGAIVKHDDVLYTCILNHTSSSANANTPGHADASPRWKAGVTPLPVGGIETVNNDETEAWTGVTFTTKALTPYGDGENYRDGDTPTEVVAGIEL